MTDYILEKCGFPMGMAFGASVVGIGTAIFPGHVSGMAAILVAVSGIDIVVGFWRRSRCD